MDGNNGQVIRQSNFELLRLVSMFYIVLYHFLRWFVQDNPAHSSLQALWLPLHVGVVCFVLISGFFRIKPSSKGLIRLITMVLVYSLPGIIIDIRNAENWREVVNSFMFLSHTNYWFVKTFLGLYLLSPLVNAFLDHSTIKVKWYTLVVTGAISVYFYSFTKCRLYEEGKNLVNFLFLYQLGQMLSYYANQWKRIKLWKLLGAYVLLNLILVLSYYKTIHTPLGGLIWRLSFSYNSPLLIINAVLLFMIFGHLSFTSFVLNRVASGVFAIYLIHGNAPLITGFQRGIVSSIYSYFQDYLLFVCVLGLAALVVMFLCLLINRLLSPVWNLSNVLGDLTYKKLGF